MNWIILLVVLIAVYLFVKNDKVEGFTTTGNTNYVNSGVLTAIPTGTIHNTTLLPTNGIVSTVNHLPTTLSSTIVNPYVQAQPIVQTTLVPSNNCTNFTNINQCMSKCSSTANCTGFYLDTPNTCCMTYGSQNLLNNYNTSGIANIPKSNLAQGKTQFTVKGSIGGANVYQSNISREACQTMCPKCVFGKCPANYRCVNMTSDPRYTQSCIITNNDMYNEATNNTLDNSTIPYLANTYGLTDYAPYNSVYSLSSVPTVQSTTAVLSTTPVATSFGDTVLTQTATPVASLSSIHTPTYVTSDISNLYSSASAPASVSTTIHTPTASTVSVPSSTTLKVPSTTSTTVHIPYATFDANGTSTTLHSHLSPTVHNTTNNRIEGFKLFDNKKKKKPLCTKYTRCGNKTRY